MKRFGYRQLILRFSFPGFPGGLRGAERAATFPRSARRAGTPPDGPAASPCAAALAENRRRTGAGGFRGGAAAIAVGYRLVADSPGFAGAAGGGAAHRPSRRPPDAAPPGGPPGPGVGRRRQRRIRQPRQRRGFTPARNSGHHRGRAGGDGPARPGNAAFHLAVGRNHGAGSDGAAAGYGDGGRGRFAAKRRGESHPPRPQPAAGL